jgi:hypothetical protein
MLAGVPELRRDSFISGAPGAAVGARRRSSGAPRAIAPPTTPPPMITTSAGDDAAAAGAPTTVSAVFANVSSVNFASLFGESLLAVGGLSDEQLAAVSGGAIASGGGVAASGLAPQDVAAAAAANGAADPASVASAAPGAAPAGGYSMAASGAGPALTSRIAKDLSRYSPEDLAQCRDLYQVLLENGALRGLSWSGAPNAFDILGTAMPKMPTQGGGGGGGGPLSPGASAAAAAAAATRKSGALQELIRKHNLGASRKSIVASPESSPGAAEAPVRPSLATFQLLVNLICVPQREKKHSRAVPRGAAAAGPASQATPGVASAGGGALDQYSDQHGGADPLASTMSAGGRASFDASIIGSHSLAATMRGSRGSIAAATAAAGGQPPAPPRTPPPPPHSAAHHGDVSRSTSPDLFADFRGSSPHTPSPPLPDDDEEAAALLLAKQSPERVLDDIKRVFKAQADRSSRAKRVIQLSRKELYAACDISPVSNFNAGYDMQRVKAGARPPVNPRLMADEIRAEKLRFMRMSAAPVGVRPSNFHGAAARAVGAPQPEPQLYHASPAHSSARHSPRATAASASSSATTPRSAPPTARAPAPSASRGGLVPTAPATARSTATSVTFRDTASPATPHPPKRPAPVRRPPSASASAASVLDDDRDKDTHKDGDASASGGGDGRRRRRTAKAKRGRGSAGADDHDDDDSSDSGSSGASDHDAHAAATAPQQTSPPRTTMRSGGLHALIHDPNRAPAARPSTAPRELSSRIKLRDALRQIEEREKESSFLATSRTLARRLRKIEVGDKVQLFDDAESKLLERWLR